MTRTGADGGDPVHLDFLLYLRARGFHVGVDEYARVLKVVDEYARAPRPADAPKLATLLCPLFAKSPKQQEQFRDLFERYFEDLRARLGVEPPPPPPPPPPEPRFGPLAVLAAALALLVIGGGVVWWLSPPPSKPAESNVNANANANLNPDANTNLNANSRATNTNESKENLNSEPHENRGGNKNVAPEPTATVAAGPVATPTPAATPTPLPPPASTPPRYYYLLAVALPLLLYLSAEAIVHLRRKLVLGRHPPRVPPAVWPLRVESAPPRLYDSEEFRDAARMMRRRQVGEHNRLDIHATVRATVAALGYPAFRYSPDSKVPEYLALIDRASFRDQQARLFDQMARALEREGLFVTRLFYDGDPRVCCDEGGGACLGLAEMQGSYAGHRLLLFGDGERLLDAETGRLAAWAEMFYEWPERALLTPEPRWGLRESVLSDLFTVVPATTEGLAALAARFESILNTNLPLRPRADGAELTPPWADAALLFDALRRQLGESAFRWLCACAVYPELQWELTLRLGSLPSLGEGLVNEENLLRLARLPWFREGALPDELRWRLVEHLAREDASALHDVRAVIVDLLEAEKPTEGTFASDRHELELAVQRSLRDGDEESLARLRDILRRVPPGRILQDRTLVRSLERLPNPLLDLLLPRRLRKLFFRGGLPWFGWRSLGRLLLAGLAACVLLLAVRLNVVPYPPAPVPAAQPAAANANSSTHDVPPFSVSIQLRSNLVQPGEEVRLLAASIDLEAVPLEYSWSTSPPGLISGSGSQVTLDTSGVPPSGGTIEVRLSARDSKGREAHDQTTISILPRRQGVTLNSLDVTFVTQGGKKNKGEPVSLTVWADGKIVGRVTAAAAAEEWANGSSHTVHVELSRPVSFGQCRGLHLTVAKGQTVGRLSFERRPIQRISSCRGQNMNQI
jgi:hypothetical protein